MKSINRFTLGIVLGVFLLSSCSDYLDINTNPNAPTETIPDFVLSGALVNTANIKSGAIPAFAGYWGGYYASSGSYSQSGDVRRSYNLLNTSFQGTWTALYANAANYNLVETQASAIEDYDYFVAVAKIMKAYVFQNLVDIYGKVPYSEALKGFDNLAPAYDDDMDIYEALADEFDAAIDIIQNAPSAAKSLNLNVKDIMFGGDTDKWARFANTLKLRLLLRQSEVAGRAAYISTEIAQIVSNGAGFLGAGEDAMINPGYTKANNLQNPFWEANGLTAGDAVSGRDFNKVSNYFYSQLTVKADPRVDYFLRAPGDKPGTNTKARPYKCVDFGALPETAINSDNTSGFGTAVLGGPDKPLMMLSAAQSMFLQAEAVLRGWITGDAQELFETGIEESFRQVIGSSAGASTYYTSGTTDTDWSVATTTDEQLHAIITQKWIANFAVDCLEAWADFRRLGIPSVAGSIDPQRLGDVMPVRLLYPQLEYNNNAAQVAKLGTISQFTSSIFWDVN